MESYLAIKRNAVLMCATTWMNLENVTLSERSQSQRPMHSFYVIYVYDSFYVKCPEERSIETEGRLVVCCLGLRGLEEVGVTANG